MSKTNKKKILNPIGKIRKKKKLKQVEFADVLGCSQATVSKLESGLLEPDLKELFNLQDKFKVNLNRLVRELYETKN